MKNRTGFFGGLHKSTKVTLLSCISFIIITMVILVFFILFPITPSEKIIASIGRENIFNGNTNGNNVTVIPEVITTTTGETTTAGVNTGISTSVGTTTTKTFKIVITSGSGFTWNGRIPVGIIGTDTKTTPVYTEPVYPTKDPDSNYVPVSTQPTTQEENADTTTEAAPEVTDAPVYTEPEYTEPAYTQPSIIIDPPATTHEVIIPVEPSYWETWGVDEW